MAEPDDDLDALRGVDPLDPVSVPSVDSPEARTLFGRITMIDATSQHDPAGSPLRPRRRGRIALAAAAAAAAVLIGLGVVVAVGSDDADDTVVQPPATAGEPVIPGGGASASCVEVYDLTTLANRELAFDGTVERVDGDDIALRVGEWFRGGTGDTVTLSGAGGLSGLTSAGEALSLEPGTRLLVAGDGGFAWSCGFTQPYDDEVARDWARTLE